MYNCIIFDVDGTIIDTETVILKSLQETLFEQKNMKFTLNELRFVLGIPGEEALQRLGITGVKQVHEAWSKRAGAYADEVSLFPGMEVLIKKASAKAEKMGIVTSKTKQELTGEFEPYGLNDYFHYMICANDTEKHKPHPDPLHACLTALDVRPEEALYIGDSIYDRECARSAGVDFGLALWGAGSKEGFDPEYCFHEPEEILDIIAN